MLNILFDYQIFSLQQYGGISRYFSEIAWRINQFEDCRSSVFCPFSVNYYLTANENFRGIKIPRIPKSGNLVRLINKYTNRIYVGLNKFDIIHKTYFFDHGKSGKKSFITVYDMINELYPQFFPDDDTLQKHRVESVKNADGIICISQNTKKDLLHFIDIDPDKVFVTHLGFSNLSEANNKKSTLQSQEPFLLYVGKRGGHKNFNLMVKGFAASRDLKNDFHLVCFGDNPFFKAEMTLFQACGLNPSRVHHISGDDTQLANAYRKATAFVYPSLYEGFGIPILEAMSCQCPVVCSNCSALPEVAGQAAEMFDPNDADSICHALENVLYSSQRSSDLIKLGVERCTKFSWDRCARETRDVYLSI